MSEPVAVAAFLRERGLADEIVQEGVDGLLARWEQAARDAERERYPFGIEDWLDELDGRQLLEDLGRAVSGALSEACAARLKEADVRLQAATVAVGHCLWGDALASRMDWHPAREWWYWRAPHAVNEDFDGA